MKKIVFLILSLVFISCQDDYLDRIFTYSETRYKIGDDISWAKKEYDDSAWDLQKSVPEDDQIFWARITMEIIQKTDTLETIGLGIHAFGAYEVYWDGILIGKNGSPGNEMTTEKTGSTTENFAIPKNLRSLGKHSVALRLSQLYKKNDPRGIYVYIAPYKKLISTKLINTIYIHILAGAFLLTAIYYLLLYINDRKTFTMLLFSLSSFLFFLLIIIEYVKFYIPIHYSNFIFRLKVIGFLTLCLSFLVPYYFAVQFPLKHHKKLSFFYALLLIGIYLFYSISYDQTALFLSQMMWLSSTLIIVHAIYNKQKAASIIFIGLIISFIVYRVSIYDVSLFVSFAIISLCMFYLLSVKLKEQRLAFESSIAESTRLKYELLKKKIQPHFLMNTLTSLIDWVEEAPNKGVEFIEALAEEFDLLNQIENEKLIPISQEIDLCKSHLNIMTYRKEIDYFWHDRGVKQDNSQLIPPAIIHTLLENGITHCAPLEDNSMTFTLIIKEEKTKLKYTFLTNGNVRNTQKQRSSGTGFKYIKARLNESYGNNWQFTSEPIENGWQNTIIIDK